VREAIVTKAQRDIDRNERKIKLEAELEKRDLNSLRKKLAKLRNHLAAKVKKIKELKVRSFSSLYKLISIRLRSETLQNQYKFTN